VLIYKIVINGLNKSMQNSILSRRVAPSITMEKRSRSDVLTNCVYQGGGSKIDLGLLASSGWASAPPSFFSKPESRDESCTPELLSLENSVASTDHTTEQTRRTKSKVKFKPLFKKQLTFSLLGVNDIPLVTSTNTSNSMPETKRYASQDLLVFKSSHLLPKAQPTPTECYDSKAVTKSPKVPSSKNLHHGDKQFLTSRAHRVQARKRVKAKMAKTRHQQGAKSGLNKHRSKLSKRPQPIKEEDQNVRKVIMNTGVLYLYRGGGKPGRAVFVRRK
jgi:hypothetical protein